MRPARTLAPVIHRRALLALSLALPLALGARRAEAYCRTSTASTATFDGHVCTPAADDDRGVPIAWGQPRITYALQRDASVQVPLDLARATLRRAFDAWTTADCAPSTPRIELVEIDPIPCARHEYNSDRGNANVVLFRDVSWPYEADRIAVTTVTFDVDSAEIYDADLEIDTALFHLTTTDVAAEADIDLLSVVTHEAGHFLGLAHAPDPSATMFATTSKSDLFEKRTLTDDDIAGICAIYPPGPIAEGCRATPRHGSSPLCADDQTAPPIDALGTTADRCCCVDDALCIDGQCVDQGGCTCATAIGSPARGATRLDDPSRAPGAWIALALIASSLARRQRATSRCLAPSVAASPRRARLKARTWDTGSRPRRWCNTRPRRRGS